MKALLVIGSPNPARSNLEWTGIVLLPTGNSQDDPHNVVSLNDNNEIRIGSISSERLAELRIVREFDLPEEIVSKITHLYKAQAKFEEKQSELKKVLSREQVDSSCDALSFLDYGSTLL